MRCFSPIVEVQPVHTSNDEFDLILTVITYNSIPGLLPCKGEIHFPIQQTLKWKDFWGSGMTCQRLESSFSTAKNRESHPVFNPCISSIYILCFPHLLRCFTQRSGKLPGGLFHSPPSKSSLMSGKQKTEGWPRFIEQAFHETMVKKNPTWYPFWVRVKRACVKKNIT